MSRPTCKGCGAIIRWIRTQGGKSMPVDPERESAWLVKDGDGIAASGRHIVLVTAEGKVITGTRGSVITRGATNVEGYVSHFATCPQANEFRKGATA